ncbi:DUF2752 domain-containing protein [Kitasatospora phosalacinea]|uniref:DUF2752 domain-containing protein n=1 Tax=Kitasatospora phosalacinea TaxID=2065 RepID=UPI0018FE234F|nr:DUF2752 domain-containing protein [Kitasatospora phosalacinea]
MNAVGAPAPAPPAAAPPAAPSAAPPAAPASRRRRPAGTVPGGAARVVLRAAAVAGAAVAVAALQEVHDPGVLCPLRLLTGVPCPLCGSTTVFVEAGHGRWSAALLANPVTALAAVALVGGPLGPGRWWRQLSYAHRNLLVGAALAVGWVWELARLGPLRS